MLDKKDIQDRIKLAEYTDSMLQEDSTCMKLTTSEAVLSNVNFGSSRPMATQDLSPQCCLKSFYIFKDGWYLTLNLFLATKRIIYCTYIFLFV